MDVYGRNIMIYIYIYHDISYLYVLHGRHGQVALPLVLVLLFFFVDFCTYDWRPGFQKMKQPMSDWNHVTTTHVLIPAQIQKHYLDNLFSEKTI